MAQSRESSVLFSLKSLMDIEGDRVRGEEQARAEREAAEKAALERQRALELEAERQRIILEEQRRAREQAVKDEEAARHAMLRETEIAKARIEAEARAQQLALAKEREHLERMTAIREGVWRRRGRLLLLVSNGASLAALGVCLGVFLGKVVPNSEQREAQLSQLAATEGERADSAERLARKAAAESSELQAQLARATSELKEVRQRLAERPKEDTKPTTKPVRGWKPNPEAAPSKRCINEFDPMCGTLD